MKERSLRPICARCKSGTIYVRDDNSIKCRRCGYDSRLAINLNSIEEK